MNTNEIEIREMLLEDIPDVQLLLVQLNEIFRTEHDISIDALTSSMTKMRNQPEIYINYVAVLDKKVVAFISSIIYLTFFHCKGTCLINELVVDKACRGMKIGEKMIHKMINFAEKRGLNQIEVGTSYDNQEAVSFYKKNGLCDEGIALGKELNS